jgi:CBS domain-containing protein
MKAQDVMTPSVVACSKDDSLEFAARIMWEADAGCLAVIDGERHVLGMITDRDVAMAAYIQGRLLRDIRVESAMSHDVRTCPLDASVELVENLMQSSQIRRVPVTDPAGRLVGIVTLGDLAKRSAPSASDVTRTLAAVTERRRTEPSAAAH